MWCGLKKIQLVNWPESVLTRRPWQKLTTVYYTVYSVYSIHCITYTVANCGKSWQLCHPTEVLRVFRSSVKDWDFVLRQVRFGTNLIFHKSNDPEGIWEPGKWMNELRNGPINVFEREMCVMPVKYSLALWGQNKLGDHSKCWSLRTAGRNWTKSGENQIYIFEIFYIMLFMGAAVRIGKISAVLWKKSRG